MIAECFSPGAASTVGASACFVSSLILISPVGLLFAEL
jgi:hypothetical protein